MSAPGTHDAVVVGVSPTTGSPTALRWAAREAELRNAPLRAVMAWRPPRPPASPGGRPPVGMSRVTADPAQDAEATLREFVTAALGTDAGVSCSAVRGNAVTALLSEARNAQLLVVGEPRPGRMNSMRASFVAPQVVLRAECPVVVMPSAVTVSA
jgi:nucleotide-binding universal stress UspA family protein